MQVLVTGGGGFIGSNLTRRLLEQGHSVRVLDDFSSGYLDNLKGLDAEVLRGDIRDSSTVRSAVEGCEVVFHLAASVGNTKSIENPILDAEVNVLGTLRLLEESRRLAVRRFVLSSSAGIFGELKTLPIAEDHPISPETPYGVSKLAAEKACLAYASLYGLEVACLRYFNVYGVNQRFDAYGNVIPIFVHRLLRSERLTVFGDGLQTRDFASVHDVVRANIAAATVPLKADVFNIGSGSVVTINRLIELLQEISGRNTGVDHAPPRPGDVRDSKASVAKAGQVLGFVPSVKLDDGLIEYWNWALQVSRT